MYSPYKEYLIKKHTRTHIHSKLTRKIAKNSKIPQRIMRSNVQEISCCFNMKSVYEQYTYSQYLFSVTATLLHDYFCIYTRSHCLPIKELSILLHIKWSKIKIECVCATERTCYVLNCNLLAEKTCTSIEHLTFTKNKEKEREIKHTWARAYASRWENSFFIMFLFWFYEY